MRTIKISEGLYKRLRCLDKKLEDTDLNNQEFYVTSFGIMLDLLEEIFEEGNKEVDLTEERK